MPPRTASRLGLVIVVAAVVAAASVAPPARAIAPPARPNFVVFMTDDQRATQTMGVMPNTLRYFQAEGTTFPNGFATTPLCCPSRSGTFSGRYAHNHHNVNNQTTGNLDYDATFAAYLKAAGYQTGLVGKFLLDWKNGSAPPHFDRWALTSGGYQNVNWGSDQDSSYSAAYTTTETSRQALRILDAFERDDDRPFVLYVAPQAPHSPWEPEDRYLNADVGTWAPGPAVGESDRSDKPSWVQGTHVSQAQGADIRQHQLRTLKSVDDMVGGVMDRLAALGEGANTVAVYTSDNGYQWGEHGLSSKYHPYNDSINVPFMVRWPGRVPQGRVDRRYVGNIDITPTLLAAAGVEPALRYPLDGVAFLDGSGLSDSRRPEAYLEYFRDQHRSIPDWSSIRTDAFQYIEYRDGGRLVFSEYYDLVTDPHQLRNLLGDGDPRNDPDTSGVAARLAVLRECSGTTGRLPCAGHDPLTPTSPGATSGYWMLGFDGVVYPFGSAGRHGNAYPIAGAVDIEGTPSGDGYWVLDRAGVVTAVGGAASLGGAGLGGASGLGAGERATSLSATPSGAGYWIFTDRGRALPRGDATFHGDLAGTTLNGPVLDSIALPDGSGYYMVASDGGVFAFGNARFHGSMGGTILNAPVQSLAPDPDGEGYWLVASDGGIFGFRALFRGSMADVDLNAPVTGMVPHGNGYLMVATDGGIFNFSDMAFHGSLGSGPPFNPIIAVAAI